MEQIDLRHLIIDFNDYGEKEDPEGYTENIFMIEANLNGERIGYMTFSKVADFPGEYFHQNFTDEKLNFIYINKISVLATYQNLGIGTMIYKKFGEIYQQKFDGDIIGRVFSSPVAEYAFRKAISMGYLPEYAFNDEYTFRTPNDRKQKQWVDLRNKLPENVRGPEVWQ